jgi:hypothetical protein
MIKFSYMSFVLKLRGGINFKTNFCLKVTKSWIWVLKISFELDLFLRLSSKSLLIKFYRVVYYLKGNLSILESFNLDLFFLQLFVILEKSLNLFQNMLWKLADIIIVRYRHIVKSNSDNFIISLALIYHSHDTDNFCFYYT